MKSIVQKDWDRCFICGRCDQALDVHHCFGGALRKKSEHYGLKVHLCHNSCHIDGAFAVHKNRNIDLGVKRFAQKAAMKKYGWNEDHWREEFYKSYLEDNNNG